MKFIDKLLIYAMIKVYQVKIVYMEMKIKSLEKKIKSKKTDSKNNLVD